MDRPGKRWAQADAAKAAEDVPLWLGRADAALALEQQVYRNLVTTSNSVVYGVIFLLLAVIPFAYVLERLTLAAANIYRQIAGFSAIFLIMLLLLATFHPAFRLSASPLMILLAFLILILSGMVIWLLYGKFEEEINRLRGEREQAHKINLRRGAVLGAAIRLGVSNLRRRLTRTLLTLTTLILLTFTLLCFSSVHESLGLAGQDVGHGSPKGILLRARGWSTLDPEVAQIARDAGEAGGIVAERYWYASELGEENWTLPVVDGGIVFNATALLGLDGQEQRFREVRWSVCCRGIRALLRAMRCVCFPKRKRCWGSRLGIKSGSWVCR